MLLRGSWERQSGEFRVAFRPGYTLLVYAKSVATSLSHAVIYSLDNLNRRNYRQFQAYISVRPREARREKQPEDYNSFSLNFHVIFLHIVSFVRKIVNRFTYWNIFKYTPMPWDGQQYSNVIITGRVTVTFRLEVSTGYSRPKW